MYMARAGMGKHTLGQKSLSLLSPRCLHRVGLDSNGLRGFYSALLPTDSWEFASN